MSTNLEQIAEMSRQDPAHAIHVAQAHYLNRRC